MATDGPAGRRDVLRAQVEQAALELFQQHGVEAVTVEQICAAAGIAVATFYRHYGTKAGVLFAYREEFLTALRAAVAGAPTSGPGHLQQALTAFARHLDAHAPALRARGRVVALNPALLPRALVVQREWEDELAAALARARGVPAGDPAVRWESALGLVVLRAAFARWTGGRSHTVEHAVAECFDEAVAAAHRLTGADEPPAGSTPG